MDANGYVYVADAENNRIQKFTSGGEFVAKTETNNDNPTIPEGVAVAADGDIYLADAAHHNIQKFTNDCALIDKWESLGSSDGRLNWPARMAVDDTGSVYVGDTHNHRIQKFTSDGTFITKWGSYGDGDGQFFGLAGVGVDADGYVYVADTNNARIQKFTSDGEFVIKWGSRGSGDGQFSFQEGVAVDMNGYVYVADTENHRIQKFTSEGGFAAKWGSFGDGNSQFYFPIGVAVDDTSNVYVVDRVNHRIQKFTSDGVFVTKWGGPGSNNGQFLLPSSVAVDSAGNVHVADTFNNRIQICTSDGLFMAKTGTFGSDVGNLNRPYGLAVSSGGGNPRVYVADTENNRIQVFKVVAVLPNTKAIVVSSGGAFPGNNLWDATQLCANFAYRTLTYQGFTKDSIHYLSSDLDLDLDGNGEPDDVDADATNAGLQNALTTWAALGGTEDVVVYLVDHGGDGSFRMSATETLSAAELDGWLDTLQASITGTLTVVYEACQSGSFAAVLAPTAGQKRIVITSTDLGENAYFLSQGTISFSIFFWTHIFNGANVLEAFDLAAQAMTQAIETQHPQYAASAGLENTFIGNGTVIQGEAPVIGAVSEGQTITGTNTATLWADPVTDADGIARVWAVLRPPNFQPSSPESPVQELPTFDLQPVGGDRYEASYDGFNASGLYHIAIYARDRIGNTCVPELTTLSVNSPLKHKAIIVGGGRHPDPQWGAYENVLGRAYSALKVQGYTDSTIAFRSPVTFNAGVDGAPSLSNIEYLIKTWGTFDTYDLVIYFVGPATAAGFEINALETLTPANLDAWVDVAQYTIPGIVTVVMDGTDSGSFLAQLSPPANTQRISMASTRPGETARFLSNGDLSFSSYFWNGVLNGAKVWNAFKQGQIAIRFFGFGQLPGLDDTGNGVGNEKLDGVLSRSHAIGAGIQLAGDAPVIGDAGATPATLTSGTTALVWAEDVTTTGIIDFVLATITPPDGGAPVELPLASAGGGRHEANYSGFTLYGDYQISVVAVDTEGATSLPAERSLSQQLGADPYEVDDTLAQARTTGIFGETTRHNFHDAGDQDWLRFWGQAGDTITMETLNLEANCDTEIALFYSNGGAVMDGGAPVVDDDGSEEPFASYYVLPLPQSAYYYLRVRYSPIGSGPGFGLGTGYDVRVTAETGGCVSSASLTVYAHAGEVKISGATVTISVTPAGGAPYSDSTTTDSNGEASFPALSDEGNYSVQVVKSGYETFTTSKSVSCGDGVSVDAPLTASSPGVLLGLNPGSLEFGQVALAAFRDMTLTVTNTGTGTLVGSASTSGVFSLQGGNTYSLIAGQSKVLTVRFTPSAAQSYDSTLTLTGGSGAEVSLTGSGFSSAAGVLGDVNTDSQINALDATLINLYLLLGEPTLNAQLATLGMNPFMPGLANVDRAGSGNGITARDAMLINLQQLMGLDPLNAYLSRVAQPSTHAGEPLE